MFGSILKEASCHWETDEGICSIVQLIDLDTRLPIIGSLYTVETQRKKGYARCLIHQIVQQLLDGGYKKCAIISDITDPITNKMFIDMGFKEVGKYISISTTKESNYQ